MMRFGTSITLPIAVLAIFTIIGFIFCDGSAWEKVFASLFPLGIALIGFSDLYYTVKAKKWDIADKL